MVTTPSQSGILISTEYTNFIDFNKNEQTIVPTKKSTCLKTKDFIDRITNKLSPTPQDYIYPKNTRFVKKMNSLDLFVIEWDPSIRTIDVERDMSLEYDEIIRKGKGTIIREGDYSTNVQKQRFTLSFPYLVWIVAVKNNHIINLKLYFRLSPLTSLNDLLILPPLLNIAEDSDGCVRTVCMGNLDEHEINGDLLGIEDSLSLFFRNSFNKDYIDLYNLYREFDESVMSNYFLWQHMTRKDPLFIFRDKWKLSSKNLKEELETIIGLYNNKDFNTTYSNLINMAYKDEILDISDDKRKTPINFIKSNSVYEELSIGDNILTVGDDLKIDDTLYYLNSIIYNNSNDNISLELEDEDGKIKTIKLTIKVKNILKKYFDDNQNRVTRLNEIINNGNKIKVGDFVNIIETSESGCFRKVLEIIKGQDGFIELLLKGPPRKRITNFLRLEKFKYKKLSEMLGGKVKKGNIIEYLNENNNNPYPYNQTNKFLYKFDKLIEYNGKITILTSEGSKIYNMSDIKILNNDNFKIIYNNTCRCGLKLFNSTDSIINNNITIINSTSIVGRFSNSVFNKKEALKSIFNENKLFIYGTDYNIEFNIGDEVVVADWDNINEMLKIKKIINFELYNPSKNETYIIDENNSIQDIPVDKLREIINVKFNLSDDHGNITSYVYIDFFGYKRQVNVPKIRKVITNYNDFSIGDIVKSKIPKIEGFPKRDCNKIIAFLNDTGCEYPLALMSNTWTIRCNDLQEYFYKVVNPEEYEISSKRPSKINTLRGDCIIFKTPGETGHRYKLIMKKDIKLIIYDTITDSYYEQLRNLVRQPFGFLNPKFDSLFNNQIENDFKNYFPNFRNWYVKINEGEHINV